MKRIITVLLVMVSISVLGQETPEWDKPVRIGDWNQVQKSGVIESKEAKNDPHIEEDSDTHSDDEWFWGLNLNHTYNVSNNQYFGGQIAIANRPNKNDDKMFFRSTNAAGFGQWSRVIATNGNYTYIPTLLGIGVKDPKSQLDVNGGLMLGLRGGDTNNDISSAKIEWNAGYLTRASIQAVNHTFGQVNGKKALRFSVHTTDEAQFSNTELLTLSPEYTGMVGIGVTDPQAKLHLHQSFPLGGGIGSRINLFQMSGNVGGNTVKSITWLRRDVADGTGWGSARFHTGIAVDASFSDPSGTTKTWWERDPYDNVQSWGTGTTSYMSLVSTGLTVQERLTAKNNEASISLSWINNQARIRLGGVGDGVGNGVSFQGPGDVEMLHISNTGNLTISGKLEAQGDVVSNGSMKMKRVLVTETPFAPDYVFESDYNLKSLEEVQSYIKEHGHLPEIPSAEEIAENGIDVWNFNSKLLMKIEELTLYTLEQEQQLTTQNEQLERVEELEAKLERMEALLEQVLNEEK